MWTTMTMTGGVDGASLKIGAKSFTEEALLAAITKIELGNLQLIACVGSGKDPDVLAGHPVGPGHQT
jgi:glycine betaine/choline ABC-type transport system substrate-binding protein